MINIVCRGCGYRIPFLKRNKDGLLFLNIECFDLICIGCGRTLIKIFSGYKCLTCFYYQKDITSKKMICCNNGGRCNYLKEEYFKNE